MPAALIHFTIDEGTDIAVEVDVDSPGFQPAGTGELAMRAVEQFGTAIGRARRAAEVALDQFTSMSTTPDEIELEMGLTLSAEAGAVLAKTSSEGHLTVKLTWRKAAE